jgi:outer membrane lipoprotein SlyB
MWSVPFEGILNRFWSFFMNFLSRTLSTASVAVLLSACATGAHSPAAKPVFYPNAKLNHVGQAAAQAEAEACMGMARQAGLTAEDNNNSVATGAARGAATAGVAAAVGTLVSGRNLDTSIRNAAGGAVVGAAAGATNGAFQDRANPTYRHFVQRCLSEKGFDVIGWN